MISQTNAWIDDKLKEQQFTRFIDRELVSAIFAAYTLEIFKRLRAKVEEEDFDKILSEHIEDRHFFHNYTYSVMIALSISEKKFKGYKELQVWISGKFEGETIYNDAKKLVFTAMLFHKTNQEQELMRLVNNCFRNLVDGKIHYYDRIYYAWVTWLYRKFLSKRQVTELTQLVKSSLENFIRQLREEKLKEATKIYGRSQSEIKPSRIALGVFIDLSNEFSRDTIMVSKEELAKTLFISRIDSLVSIALLVVDFGLFYLAIANGVLTRIPTELTIEKLFPVAIVNIIMMLFIVLIATASLSLFWDTAIKGYANKNLIINNMKSRVKKWIEEIIIGNIFLGILIAVLLGI